ncbi:hypothetical protein ACLOJK_038970 [Asimina triloba]
MGVMHAGLVGSLLELLGRQRAEGADLPWTLNGAEMGFCSRWRDGFGKADRDGAVGVNGKNGKRRWCGCWRRTGGRADGRCWPCVAVVLAVVARDGWWQGRAD